MTEYYDVTVLNPGVEGRSSGEAELRRARGVTDYSGRLGDIQAAVKRLGATSTEIAQSLVAMGIRSTRPIKTVNPYLCPMALYLQRELGADDQTLAVDSMTVYLANEVGDTWKYPLPVAAQSFVVRYDLKAFPELDA